LIDAALAYALRGIYVLPTHSLRDGECTCSPWYKRQHPKHKKTKHPITRHGFKDATNDPMKVRRHWVKWPWANVSIATGASGLLAFDPDTRNNGHLILEELEAEEGQLPASWTLQSGSGDLRYLYRLPEGVTLPTGHVQRPCGTMDIIAATGYIVAVGIHASGNPYVDLGGAITELPARWVNRLSVELGKRTTHTHR
jgi:hypothetical protein